MSSDFFERFLKPTGLAVGIAASTLETLGYIDIRPFKSHRRCLHHNRKPQPSGICLAQFTTFWITRWWRDLRGCRILMDVVEGGCPDPQDSLMWKVVKIRALVAFGV